MVLLGPVLVACYATVMVVTVLVLEPLAAMPGLTYAEVVAGLEADDTSMTTQVVVLLVLALLGISASVAVSAAGLRRAVLPGTTLQLQLAVLALGAVAYFWGSFGVGMGLADAFGIDGGDHSAVPAYLYALSGAALTVLAGIYVRLGARASRRKVPVEAWAFVATAGATLVLQALDGSWTALEAVVLALVLGSLAVVAAYGLRGARASLADQRSSRAL